MYESIRSRRVWISQVHFLVECMKSFIYNVKLPYHDSEVVDGGAIA
jgi:hypothetical protein